ncbi:MAG: hypothetical protein FWD09_01150 [Lentimicrobiaceae bacterium]|nr:hypothetical protein [Lentimicrobiaceae bacterium]
MVCTKQHIYIIETKGNDKMEDRNVQSKQRATIEWCEKINTLPAEKRMGRTWLYVLLSEGVFYAYSDKGVNIDDICAMGKVRRNLFE